MRDARTVPDRPTPGAWVHRSERGYEVVGYEGCAEGFQSPAFLQSVMRTMGSMGMGSRRGGRSLTTTEGAEHAELRRVVAPWFTPRRVASLRERTDVLVRRLLSEVGDGGDVMPTVAMPLPGLVFCWMTGAPETWAPRLVDLSFTLLQMFEGDPSKADEIRDAARELGGMVRELVAARASEPDEGLVSVLLDAAAAGRISDADVQSLAFELLSASTDNTVNAAGIVLHLLATHPDQRDKVAADRSLVPNAVEESLRLDPRVRVEHVFNPAPATLLDVEFPADSELHLDLHAAHHDPDVFADPGRFDVERALPRPQLNFGVGRHFCIGAALARMELEVVVDATLDRWPALEPAGPAVITRGESTTVHELPLTG